MIIRPLFPDEFIKGYLPRTLRECVLSNTNDLFRKAQHTERLHSVGKAQLAATLCAVSTLIGVRPEQLVRHNSMVPVQHCVFDSRTVKGSDGYSAPEFLRFALFSGSIARLCPKCVVEDIEVEGLSYWHRSHQFLGINWCLKHGCPLGEHLVSKGAFAVSPLTALRNARPSLHDNEVRRHKVNPVISKYERVVTLLASELSQPICVTAVASLLAGRAREVGVRISRAGRRRALSDLVAEYLPSEWVKETFRVTPKTTPDGTFSDWIDQCLHIRSKPASGYAYALALAVLWDDPEHAVSLALQAPQRKPMSIAKPVETQVAEMVLLWVKHKASLRTIARDVGVSIPTVVKKLRALGIPRLAKTQRTALTAAFRQFAQGSSIDKSWAIGALEATSIQRIFNIAIAREGAAR